MQQFNKEKLGRGNPRFFQERQLLHQNARTPKRRKKANERKDKGGTGCGKNGASARHFQKSAQKAFDERAACKREKPAIGEHLSKHGKQGDVSSDVQHGRYGLFEHFCKQTGGSSWGYGMAVWRLFFGKQPQEKPNGIHGKKVRKKEHPTAFHAI